MELKNIWLEKFARILQHTNMIGNWKQWKSHHLTSQSSTKTLLKYRLWLHFPSPNTTASVHAAFSSVCAMTAHLSLPCWVCCLYTDAVNPFCFPVSAANRRPPRLDFHPCHHSVVWWRVAPRQRNYTFISPTQPASEAPLPLCTLSPPSSFSPSSHISAKPDLTHPPSPCLPDYSKCLLLHLEPPPLPLLPLFHSSCGRFREIHKTEAKIREWGGAEQSAEDKGQDKGRKTAWNCVKCEERTSTDWVGGRELRFSDGGGAKGWANDILIWLSLGQKSRSVCGRRRTTACWCRRTPGWDKFG